MSVLSMSVRQRKEDNISSADVTVDVLRLAGQAVVGEHVAGEIHPATHGEAATHGDQDSQDEDAVIYNDLDQVVVMELFVTVSLCVDI